MDTSVPQKAELYETIDRLTPDQLARLWEFVQQLTEKPVAPLYRIHEQAIATGVPDLADHHDLYLYGQDSPDV